MREALERRYQDDARFRRLFQSAAWALIGGVALGSGAYFVDTMRYVEAHEPRVFAARNALASVMPSPFAGPSGVRHVPLPEEVRGIYMTAHSAGSKAIRDGLVAYIERNDLNAVVIDVKDGNGRLAFHPRLESLAEHDPERATMEDMDEFLAELGEKGIYRIARVFVFQDPNYVALHPEEAVRHANGGIWRDHKGVPWVDAASRAAWDYNVEISKDVYERGFDEIQFDYIRFPSDGNLSTIRYTHHDPSVQPKWEVIGEFFDHMHRELEERRGIPISYDLFGYVTWHWGRYDLNIGQRMEYAMDAGTAISAMVYPSHYGAGTLGFANPAEHPYEIVADSMRKANALVETRDRQCAEGDPEPIVPCDAELAHQRPWIQAFDIGAVYGPDKYRAQVQAVRDTGGKGWLLWNARNVYRDFTLP